MRTQCNRPGSIFCEGRGKDDNLWALMAHAELFIHVGCSTSALEWAYTGKPQGQIRTPVMHRDFAEEGVSVPVDNCSWIDACKKIEYEWMQGAYRDRQKLFVEEEIANPDAAEKIVEQMIAISKGEQ